MSLLDHVLAPVKGLLGHVEQDAEDAFPVAGLVNIEQRVLDTGLAIQGATESISSHVAVIESLTETLNAALPALTTTLSTTLPDLVAAVQDLGTKLEVVAEALAPVVEAEQKLSKVGHLFGHHQAPGTDAPAG